MVVSSPAAALPKLAINADCKRSIIESDMRLTVISIGVATAALLSLGGCGIKPDFVDPPRKEKADGTRQTLEESRKEDKFPRTYPDPAFDPAPKPAPAQLIR